MGATILRVKRILIIGGEIDVFDDVDFSVCRPILACHPKSGPDGASKGHVNSVHDDQTSRFYLILAQHLDSISAVRAIGGGAGEIIHFDNNVSERVNGREILLRGERLVGEVHIPLVSGLSKEIRGVIACLEIP